MRISARTLQLDFSTSWCHGSAGVGLGMLDLHRRTGEAAHLDKARRAAHACAAEDFVWSHSLCHGDYSTWELLTALDFADRAGLDTEIAVGPALDSAAATYGAGGPAVRPRPR
ncbi:lanthionine synthetase LanC family protein [Streptomyces sp. NPDC001581]|uniref:lanthionine synthetase LanC family protein n=1 Tax=Streptomyces sp. NPDC001581 TaxID=3154386 RepID=UPI00331693EA